MKTLTVHPIAKLLPKATPAERDALKADIALNGQREPIVLIGDQIIDGRQRYEICRELGIAPVTKQWDRKGSLTLYVYSHANHRHLCQGQKACASVQIKRSLAKEAKTRGVANLKQYAGRNISTGEPGLSRDISGSLFGVSGRYVQDAEFILRHDPRLFRAVFDGTESLPVAKRMVRTRLKRETLVEKARTAPRIGDWEIRCQDGREGLATLSQGAARLVVWDPPYNIGIDYGNGAKADRLSDDEYLAICTEFLTEAKRVLAVDGTLALIISDEYAADVDVIARRTVGLHRRSWVKWFESFGNHVADNFSRTSRHVFIYNRRPGEYVFHRDAFLRASDRAAKYEDKRAANGGMKVWDDVWGINPPIPRLVENSAERVPGFPTQLPLALVKPIVLGFSDPGDLVCDPCAGSGTTIEAAVTTGRKAIGFDVSKIYVAAANTRVLAACAAAVPEKPLRARNAS